MCPPPCYGREDAKREVCPALLVELRVFLLHSSVRVSSPRMLLALVILYLLGTIALGLWAAKRVKTTSDFAIAVRHLPLAMIVTTTFATWFGSETVLGIPAKFVNGGLNSVVEDPFGAGAYQVTLVGAFVPLAAGLYWKRATTQGAVFSIVLGILSWVIFLYTPAGESFPPQLAGFLMAITGM